jgi:hypothetical protein
MLSTADFYLKYVNIKALKIINITHDYVQRRVLVLAVLNLPLLLRTVSYYVGRIQDVQKVSTQ